MFAVFFCNRHVVARAYALGLLICGLLVAKSVVDLRTNTWIGKFYDEVISYFLVFVPTM
eukprot:SAG31_NODE_21015_length_559_cov_1.800000_2_plen_59_part_00